MRQSPNALIVFLSFCTVIILLYCALLAKWGLIWRPEHERNKPLEQGISLIIPTYNDSHKLKALLATLKVTSPVEIIVVNDGSNHSHSQCLKDLAQRHAFALINHTGIGKKQALAAGIEAAGHDIIVQLDADVVPGEAFLSAIAAPFQDAQTNMVLGLVKMEASKNVWSKLAALDFLSLQFTGHALAQNGQAIMGSGAAMAYRKEVYERYKNHGRGLSSGDDVFLIQALAREAPDSIKTSVLAHVNTQSPSGFNEFIQQRVRWGSKTTSYNSLLAKALAALVACVNWLVVALFLASFFSPLAYLGFLVLFGLKLIIEYLVLANFARKTNQIALTKHFVWATIYPLYIVVATLLIVFAKDRNTWKGRPVTT